MQSDNRPAAGAQHHGVVASQVAYNRKEFIEYIESRTHLIQNISNSVKNMKSAVQRGQVKREVVQDLIDDIPKDIQNIIDGLQDGPYVQQIAINDQDSFQIIKTNLQSMQNTLRAIQDDMRDIEDDKKNKENAMFTSFKCFKYVYDDNAEFGDDWFRWEDWRVDKKFMSDFYDILSTMLIKDPLAVHRQQMAEAAVSGVNPIIEMLLRRKGDQAIDNLDIDKMIRFFNTVGGSYWYAINKRKFNPDEAINSLKGNPYITTSSYIAALKLNGLGEK